MSNLDTLPVAVVGAGPIGLAAAAHLIFEGGASHLVGGIIHIKLLVCVCRLARAEEQRQHEEQVSLHGQLPFLPERYAAIQGSAP